MVQVARPYFLLSSEASLLYFVCLAYGSTSKIWLFVT